MIFKVGGEHLAKFGLDILLRTPCEPGPKKIGSYYTYNNYELHDREVVYEYVITPRTNRLNLCEIFKEVGLEFTAGLSECCGY